MSEVLTGAWEAIQEIFTYALLFGPPIAALVWFIVSLILSLKTKKDDPKKKGRRIRLIVSGVVLGFFVLLIIGLYLLLLAAIATM